MTNETAGRKAASEFDRDFKPRPYSPDHPDLLARGLPRPAPRLESVANMSGGPRLALTLLALLLALYGLHGLIADGLYLPQKHGQGHHYQGAGAVLVCTVILCLSGALLALAFGKTRLDRRWKKHEIVLGCLCVGAMALVLAWSLVDAARS